MSENGSQDLVYRTIIDTKKSLQQLQKFEKRLVTHEKKVQRLKQTTAQIEAKEARKTSTIKQRSESKELAAKARAELQKQKLAEKTAKKEKMFEQWKTAQLRSAAYARLNIEQQMNLKRILSAKKSEEEIRDEWKRSTSIFLREQKRRKMMQKNREKVNTNKAGSVGKNAGAGAASGGLIAGALMNPYILAGTAAVAGGAMAVKSGAEDYQNLQQGAQLTGMDFNTYARESAGMAAVSGMSQETISDKFKDIADRQGEFLNESKFNNKTGQYEGGEGSILANQLLKTGMNQQQVQQTMQLDPAEFIKTVSTALKDTDIKTQTFALEAFGSDLTNIVKGMQQNKSGYETAKANATTFSDDDIAKAKEFQLALSGIASSLGQIPLNMFKEFTNSLSPEALEMLGKLGEALGKLGGIFGDLLAYTLNLVSGALNPLLDVINWLLEKIKPLTEMLADFGGQFSGMLNGIADAISGFFKSIISKLPDWMVPDSWNKKSDDANNGDTTNSNNTYNTHNNSTVDNSSSNTTHNQNNVTNSTNNNSYINNKYNTANNSSNSYIDNKYNNNAYNTNNYNNVTNNSTANNVNNTTNNSAVRPFQRVDPLLVNSSIRDNSDWAKQQLATSLPQQQYIQPNNSGNSVASQNPVQVQLVLDGTVISEIVVGSEQFNSSVTRQMNAANGGY